MQGQDNMVQIIRRTPHKTTSDYMADALRETGRAVSDYSSKSNQKKATEAENKAIKNTYDIDLSGVKDPKARQAILAESLKGKRKQSELEDFRNIFNPHKNESIPKEDMSQQTMNDESLLPKKNQMQPQQSPEMSMDEQTSMVANIPDEKIVELSLTNPAMAREVRAAKDAASKMILEKEKRSQKLQETERAFHTGYSKEQEKEAETLRTSIPKKEMALSFARDAVETGDLKYFSLDKLADATGIDLFRTAKGAQLVTAGKENLLSNMGRVSARAQNIWFEQRLNSMFPKVGQSNEANLTVQEMLEGEVALDKAYLNEFDRIVEQDEKQYGFTKKDASKRARNNVKPLEKEILARTSYRMKEVEEKERGLGELKKSVGKNVTKGTPMTLAMAKLYKDKYGENALSVAEKNGYHIPTKEEFKIYQTPFSQLEKEEQE